MTEPAPFDGEAYRRTRVHITVPGSTNGCVPAFKEAKDIVEGGGSGTAESDALQSLTAAFKLGAGLEPKRGRHCMYCPHVSDCDRAEFHPEREG